MDVNIEEIKRKLVIRYSHLGSLIVNIAFKECEDIETVATDGKNILYNPEYVKELSDKQKLFIFAHEICHIAFEHISRREGKNMKLWNIATDSVINALLKKDGLVSYRNAIDIPEAINYDAEEMYNKLLKEQEERENKQEKPQDEQSQQEDSNIGHATHDLWGNFKDKEEQEGKKQKSDEVVFIERSEKKTFEQIKKRRKQQLQELSRELASQSSYGITPQNKKEGRKLDDIGIARSLIDWKRHLRQAIKYNEEWSRRNARMRNGYFRHKIEQTPILETEILLDTSGSVSETLLKNFLRECKSILTTSKVKIGCFNIVFNGFTELRNVEDIDTMHFEIGGGTDFNVAVNSFSRKPCNKIIFTDGLAPMPSKTVNGVIWIVFGNTKINPKGGKVINISDEQLQKLYTHIPNNKSNNIR